MMATPEQILAEQIERARLLDLRCQRTVRKVLHSQGVSS